MYDQSRDGDSNTYFPSTIFKGFNRSKIAFIGTAVKAGIKADLVILSHINLLLVAWMIKIFSPSTRIILLAHGIEIWGPLNWRKRMMLKACDTIVSVSKYTSEIIRQRQGIAASRCRVLNNCLDPFLPASSNNKKDPALLKQYGFSNTDTILFTLTRLAVTERYKGYVTIINCLPELKKTYPNIKYLIAGKYTEDEKNYLMELAAQQGVAKDLVLAGYVPDKALAAYFQMADIYIMPSKKEGFGIVFIEAMYYGLPVIAGNVDGSVDALLNGQLGKLVNPDNIADIKKAIWEILSDKEAFIPNRELLLEHFSFENYKNNWERVLEI